MAGREVRLISISPTGLRGRPGTVQDIEPPRARTLQRLYLHILSLFMSEARQHNPDWGRTHLSLLRVVETFFMPGQRFFFPTDALASRRDPCSQANMHFGVAALIDCIIHIVVHKENGVLPASSVYKLRARTEGVLPRTPKT